MIKGVKIFKDTIFKDKRGYIWTSYQKKRHELNYVHDKFSSSKKNVLRGLHGDKKTWKLVSCVFGEVFFVVVNFNSKSRDYKKYTSLKLNYKNNKQILVPPNFLNGFLCLSNECLFHYKLFYKGNYFDSDKQISIKWNDPSINIKWPKVKKIILSKRDT